jgi:hypothetical protein
MLKSSTSDSCLEWFNVRDYKQSPNMVGDSKITPFDKVKKEMQQTDTCLSEQDIYKELLKYFIGK